MLRLYIGSVIMSIGNLIIPKYFVRPDNIALMNNIFATLFMITIYLSIVDFISKAIKERQKGKIFLGILLFIAPVAIGILLAMSLAWGSMFLVRLALIIPTPIFVEGGPVLIVMGIIMYIFREDRNKLIMVFSAMSLALILTGQFTIESILMKNYQWMMVFAAPLFYLYNGQKGRGMKYLFYIFYPAHIYIFYIASSIIMNR